VGAPLQARADAGGFVQSFFVFFFRIRIRDDTGTDMIAQALVVSHECSDGDVE
jgi:hypothetical protein